MLAGQLDYVLEPSQYSVFKVLNLLLKFLCAIKRNLIIPSNFLHIVFGLVADTKTALQWIHQIKPDSQLN